MDAQEILTKLRELKPTITERYKVKEISLFGSFVREEQEANSDIDLLVDFEEDADLFDLVGLSLYLEETFQRRVDVISKRSLRKELRKSVLQQAIRV